MGRRRKGKRLDPEAVARGLAPVGVGELMRLIHEVNPTGREVGAEEAARRYRTKARLQSRLLLEFGEQIVVRADDPEASVVSLSHRSGTFDACHAVVAELDDEARSWVRRRLDEATEAEAASAPPRPFAAQPAGTPGPSEAAGPAELREQARAAVAEYDYEAARLLLLKALDLEPGGLETARALLDLLVDQLGADQDALELESRLRPPASDDAEVRVRLALAAARLAQTDRAQHLLRGVRGPRAAEAQAALAQAAIQAGDDAAAGRWIDELRVSAPDTPELLRLGEAREELRAQQRAPLEAAMEEAWRGGRAEEAERRAHEILARWPESRAAAHLVHEISSRQRLEEQVQRLQAAAEALTQGDPTEARGLYREAEAIGGRDPALWARIEQALSEAQARADRDRLVRLQRELAGDSRRASLLEYLSLPDEQRAALRARSGAAALSWLEEGGAAGTGTGARARSAVDGVLALETAQALLAEGRSEEVAALLAAHEKGLRGVREAQALLDRAGEQSAARQRAEAEAMVGAAAAAIERGDVEEGERLLSACDARRLSEEAQRRARELSERAARAAETRLLALRLQEARRSDDLLLARDLAGELAERGAGDERTRWLEEQDRLRDAVRRKWQVRVLTGESPGRLPPGALSLPRWEEAAVWLTADGGRIAVCSIIDGWIFVQVLEVASGCLLGGARLKAQAPFGEGSSHLVHGDCLFVFGPAGRLLSVSTSNWEVLGDRSLGELVPSDLTIEQIHALPDADRAWVITEQSDGELGPTLVVDLSAERTSRTLPPTLGRFIPIWGSEKTRVVGARDDRSGGALYAATGTARHEIAFPGRLHQVASHPEGGGLLALVASASERDEDEEDLLGAVELKDRGPVGKPLILWDAVPLFAQALATALDARLAFALLSSDGEGRTLVALERAPAGLRTVYRTPVPRGTVLAHDGGSRRVVLVSLGTEGLELHPLGRERPRVGLGVPVDLRHELPPTEGWLTCGRSEAASRARLVAALRGRLLTRQGKPASEEPAEDDGWYGPDLLTELHAVRADLEPGGHSPEELRRLLQGVVEEHADEPAFELSRVELLTALADWEGVRRLVEGLDLCRFAEGACQHLLHLLGLARLWLGDADKARAAFEETQKLDGSCNVEGLCQLLAPLPSPLDPEHWAEDQPLVRRLRACVTAADAAIVGGDLEAAIEILERPLVWSAQEVQSLARLAEAQLRLADDRAWFDTSLAAAAFRHAHARDPLYRRELPFPGATWDRSRLDDLARRCLEYLEAPQDA